MRNGLNEQSKLHVLILLSFILLLSSLFYFSCSFFFSPSLFMSSQPSLKAYKSTCMSCKLYFSEKEGITNINTKIAIVIFFNIAMHRLIKQ